MSRSSASPRTASKPRGENGIRLKDAWLDTPRTYLGMLAEGFPNVLMVLGPHTARQYYPGDLTQ